MGTADQLAEISGLQKLLILYSSMEIFGGGLIMERICDLHTHTIYSDGTFTPTELVKHASEAGLSAIALTDHNSVSGVDEFMSAADKEGIIGVAGCEFSTVYGGIELHLLGLFIDPQYFDRVTEHCEQFRIRKKQSTLRLIENLANGGYKVDYEKIVSKTPDGYVNRAHVAVDLVRNGYVGSVREAFDSLLSEKSGFYQPPIRQGTMEAIKFVRSIGAVPVLAHPLLQLSENELREFLKSAVPEGLCGIETEYSLYSVEKRRLSACIAKEYGLLQSGGSDFHGANKPDRKIAFGRENIRVPFEFYEELYRKSLEM